jgi:hypothetical protein
MDGDTKAGTSVGMYVLRPFQISPKSGARTSIFLATAPEVAGRTGMYWVRRKPGRMSRDAGDDAMATRLWDESDKLLAAAGFPTPGQ